MSFLEQIRPNVLVAIEGIVGLLIFATVVVFTLKKLAPEKNFEELQKQPLEYIHKP